MGHGIESTTNECLWSIFDGAVTMVYGRVDGAGFWIDHESNLSREWLTLLMGFMFDICKHVVADK